MPGSWPTASEDRIENVAQAARDRAAELATDLTGIQSTDEIHVRDLLPQEDLETGGDNDWNGDDAEWTQQGLSEGSNTTYVINSNERADDKVVVLYLVKNRNAAPITNQLEVRAGRNGQLGVRDIVDLETMFTEDDAAVLLQEGMVFRHNESGQIIQHAAEAGDDNLILRGAVAEPRGNTLTPRDETRGN